MFQIGVDVLQPLVHHPRRRLDRLRPTVRRPVVPMAEELARHPQAPKVKQTRRRFLQFRGPRRHQVALAQLLKSPPLFLAEVRWMTQPQILAATCAALCPPPWPNAWAIAHLLRPLSPDSRVPSHYEPLRATDSWKKRPDGSSGCVSVTVPSSRLAFSQRTGPPGLTRSCPFPAIRTVNYRTVSKAGE